MFNTKNLHHLTLWFALAVVILAALSALTIYAKELGTLDQLNRNIGLTLAPTEKERMHLAKEALIFFAIFCFPLILIFKANGKKLFQFTIVLTALVTFILALGVHVGGDYKGCDECGIPVVASVASTVFASALISVVSMAASIFKFFTKGNRKIDDNT